MSNKKYNNNLGESLDSYKKYEKIDELSFIFSLHEKPFQCNSFEVQVKNIVFFGIISTDKLATTLKDCFVKYFSQTLKNKQEINKMNFMHHVNDVIFPSQITSIGEIKFRLLVEKVRESDNTKNPETKDSQWNYNLIPLINKFESKKPEVAKDELTPSI